MFAFFATAVAGWAPGAALAVDRLANVPSISLGSGRSEIVEYDAELRPVRRYTGLENPADIAPTANGTFLFTDLGTKRVTEVTRDGTVRWSENIGAYPMRVRMRPGGGLLVTTLDKVVALRPDRTVDFELSVPHVTSAAPLANGNVLVAYNDGQGWLAEMNPAGEAIRRTAARGRVDSSGRWFDEARDNYFVSVSSVDVAGDGSIVAANFDASEVRLLGSELGFVRSISGFPHAWDTRFGPNESLAVVTPEDWSVTLIDRAGRRRIEPPMSPRCAAFTPWGTVLVGMWWTPEEQRLNATALRTEKAAATPWWRRALPLPITALLFSVVSALVLRRREIAAAVLPGRGVTSAGLGAGD